MTNEQHQVKSWMQSFGQETPEKPTIPSLEVRKLRAKLHLEECLETIKALGFVVYVQCEETRLQMSNIDILEDTDGCNLLEVADGCEDLKVVTEGTLIACGLIDYKNYKGPLSIQNNDPLFDEVMRSNWSKMWSREEVNRLPPYHKYHVFQQDVPRVDLADFVVTDEKGKVQKSPSYSHANLQPIIDEMSK